MKAAIALLVSLMTVLSLAPAARSAPGVDPVLNLTLRSRGADEVVEKAAKWDARQTAVIVIDVWDKHWCEGANRRVGEMVGRMNAFVTNARDRGAFIVHAPSDTMKNYEGTPQRKLAQTAPKATPPKPITGWRYLDKAREGALPIDDSDGGCDCEPQCKNQIAWKGQHAAVKIADNDAISADGKEIYNLLHQRGVKHVIILGVHTNMCILGRTFGIRQMVDEGFDVALVRDLTDTMYNPRKAPFVPHERGTALVIEHVERYWCPTILASQLLGDSVSADPRPHVVLAICENEYKAKETLPALAKEELERKRGWTVTVLQSDDPKNLPGTEVLEKADLLVVYMRRTTLPEEQLARFKRYFESGKPVVGLRTASHAFQNWLEFDKLVLGGNYGNHYGKGDGTKVSIAAGAEGHPILRGATTSFTSASWLYRNTPLGADAKALLTGQFQQKDPEPVAWTHRHRGGKVFYTSLGHADDFASPQFRRLVVNALLWAVDRPVELAGTTRAAVAHEAASDGAKTQD